MNIKKRAIVATVIITIIFFIKLIINQLLLAENGDTYDFFKIAYYLQQANFNYHSKRHILLPILLTPFPPENFVFFGRIIINVFYFLSVFVFYEIVKKLLNNQFTAILATLTFAFNYIIFENSFYILADSLFLFLNLSYIYIYKKNNHQKPLYLSIVSALAFYTRPEGAILVLVTVILYAKNFYKNNLLTNFKLLKNIGFLKYLLSLAILLLPHFLRNFIYYKNPFHSGYFSDPAGFIFDKASFLLRISNLFFGHGGFWLIPVIVLFFNFNKLKHLKLEILLLFLYLVALFLWGPYIRLYTIPIGLLIFITFALLNTAPKINQQKIFIAFFITLILAIFYLYIVQIYNYRDLGFSKLGKALCLLGSIIIVILSYFIYYKNKFNKYLLLITTTLIIFLNLGLFVDKFYITRHKYSTIKQAVQYYLQVKDNGENLSYSNESGVESWYLKDFTKRYYYGGNTNLSTYLKTNNIKYFITTDEMGYKDNFSKLNLNNIEKFTIVKKYKSPFFPGSTKLVKIIDYSEK